MIFGVAEDGCVWPATVIAAPAAAVFRNVRRSVEVPAGAFRPPKRNERRLSLNLDPEEPPLKPTRPPLFCKLKSLLYHPCPAGHRGKHGASTRTVARLTECTDRASGTNGTQVQPPATRKRVARKNRPRRPCCWNFRKRRR